MVVMGYVSHTCTHTVVCGAGRMVGRSWSPELATVCWPKTVQSNSGLQLAEPSKALAVGSAVAGLALPISSVSCLHEHQRSWVTLFLLMKEAKGVPIPPFSRDWALAPPPFRD